MWLSVEEGAPHLKTLKMSENVRSTAPQAKLNNANKLIVICEAS